VQQIFYEDPDVLTLSFHESGAFLYPGTGFIEEMGAGDGYGYSVNVPLDPHTDDESFLDCVGTLVPRIAELFGPDVIVLQAGCDAHVLDPLTHLRCTTRSTATPYASSAMPRTNTATAAWWQRAAADTPSPGGAARVDTRLGHLRASSRTTHCRRISSPCWSASATAAVPATLIDPPDAFERIQPSIDAQSANRATVDAVRRRCLPLISGWGLGF
jgi:acetoin utilization protein AcuC